MNHQIIVLFKLIKETFVNFFLFLTSQCSVYLIFDLSKLFLVGLDWSI
jgi:hypothetical protein